MKKLNKFLIFYLVFLIFIAAVPRSIEVLSQNYLWGFDQGVFYKDVKEIVVDGDVTLIGTEVGGSGGFFQGPGWYYLLALPFALTGGDPYSGQVLMFVLGIGAAVLAFFLLRSLYGRTEGVIASLLVAISPAIITQARFIWPPFPITILALLFLYFLYRVFQKHGYFFPLLTFTLGLMTHFETATAATLLISFLPFVLFIFLRKLVTWKNAAVGLGTLVLSQIALIIFDLRNEFLNIKGIFKLASGSSSEYSLPDVFENVWQVMRDNFIGTFPGGEYFWPIILLILFIGSFAYLTDKKHSFAQKAFIWYLLLTPFILFLIFLNYKGLVWGWWVLELNIYYIVLFAVILGYIWKKKNFKTLVIILISLFMLMFVKSTITFFKNDFNDFGGIHKIKGKIQAIDFIYQDAKGQPFNIQIFTPPIYSHAYDYLFWWHGKTKYGFVPEYKKEGTFYLLIEPDPHQEWTYEGWLETVVKDGEVVLERELPSGFIIQKRVIE